MEEPKASPGQEQPWRKWWPPKENAALTEDEREKQPWLDWKPDAANPNAKPWLNWVPRGIYNYKVNLHGRGTEGGGGGRTGPGSSNAEGG